MSIAVDWYKGEKNSCLIKTEKNTPTDMGKLFKIKEGALGKHYSCMSNEERNAIKALSFLINPINIKKCCKDCVAIME